MNLLGWTARSHQERIEALAGLREQELQIAQQTPDPAQRAQHLANAEQLTAQIYPGALNGVPGAPQQPEHPIGGLVGHLGGLAEHIRNALIGSPQPQPQSQATAPAPAIGGTPPNPGSTVPQPLSSPGPQLGPNGLPPHAQGGPRPIPAPNLGPLEPPLAPPQSQPQAQSQPQSQPQPLLSPQEFASAQGPMGSIQVPNPDALARIAEQAKQTGLNTHVAGTLQRMQDLAKNPALAGLQPFEIAQMAAGGNISPAMRMTPMLDSKPVLGKDVPIQSDSNGKPVDPNGLYRAIRDPFLGTVLGYEPIAQTLMQGPLQQGPQGTFQKQLVGRYGGQVQGALNAAPPSGLLPHQTSRNGIEMVKQPDGSIVATPVHTSSTSTPILNTPPGVPASGTLMTAPPIPTSADGSGRGNGTLTQATGASPSLPSKPQQPTFNSRQPRGAGVGGGASANPAAGQVVGGTPPSTMEKRDLGNLQESLRIGNDIHQMLSQIPEQDRKAGTLDEAFQTAAARVGAKAYKSGIGVGQYQNRLYALIDRLDAMGRKALQTGGPRAVQYSQIIAQHLPKKTDAYPLIVDKLDTMMQGLNDLQQQGFDQSPQFHKLLKPVNPQYFNQPPARVGDNGGDSAVTKESLAAKYGIKLK